jgi:plasmid segregation protein ParM
MEVIGIDIGFGFTKATNGKETIIFKSIFGDASEIQFWADFGDSSPTDHIHVAIDGKSYFVGDLAEQQSSVLNFTLDQERLISDYVRILALTVTGLFFNNNTPINVPINVVSGLPIGYFKQNHERFNEILTGHHSVTYHSHNGEKSTREIYINKVRMLPQPLGSILNNLMDANGKIVDEDLPEGWCRRYWISNHRFYGSRSSTLHRSRKPHDRHRYFQGVQCDFKQTERKMRRRRRALSPL